LRFHAITSLHHRERLFGVGLCADGLLGRLFVDQGCAAQLFSFRNASCFAALR
jgi:hypothetical protein